MGGADLLVWVEAADVEESGAPNGDVMRVENKRDLGRSRDGWIGATATSDGVVGLRTEIERWVAERTQQPWIGLARHRDRVSDGVAALREARSLVELAGPPELIAFQLGIAERRLAEVSGRGSLGPVGEEVLTSIFSRFCIGK